MALSPRPWVALVALVALVASVAPPARGWDTDAPTATLSVENGGQWGQWGDPEFCPGKGFASGFQLKRDTGGQWGHWGDPEFCPGKGFASGFQLKVEPHKGFFGDDTGLNGVRLLCGHAGQATSSEGPRGSWSRPESCPSGQRLVAFRLRVEAPRGSGTTRPPTPWPPSARGARCWRAAVAPRAPGATGASRARPAPASAASAPAWSRPSAAATTPASTTSSSTAAREPPWPPRHRLRPLGPPRSPPWATPWSPGTFTDPTDHPMEPWNRRDPP
ncbi:uncharacterized protein ACIQIH_000257 [Cyanocitta cristata]